MGSAVRYRVTRPRSDGDGATQNGIHVLQTPSGLHAVRALVTGGAGFIGSSLVEALVEQGDHVAVLDDLSRGRPTNLHTPLYGGGDLHLVDVTDAPAVHEVMRRERPDVVFHLAAQIDVRRSLEDSGFDARVNIEGTINTLEAARRHGVRRVVLASTGAIYGESEPLPSPEDCPISPLSAYGLSKYAAESYCHLYTKVHGLSTLCLRYGNVYGPRQDPGGEAGVIAIFCRALLDGGRPTIFGDGRQTRDYVYVEDVVSATMAAAESDATGSMNVGRGEETSVLDVVGVLRELAPRGFEPRHVAPREGEVLRSCLDPSHANGALGWEAGIDLRGGLRLTVDDLRAGSALPVPAAAWLAR